jgi:hypothetical protein
MAVLLSLIGFMLFIAMLVGLYIWSRRTESDMDFEQAAGVKSEAQADALRLGMAINGPSSNVGGH